MSYIFTWLTYIIYYISDFLLAIPKNLIINIFYIVLQNFCKNVRHNVVKPFVRVFYVRQDVIYARQSDIFSS